MKKPLGLRTIRSRRAVSGYLFILPFIVGFLAFMVKPLIDSFYMSLCEVTVGPNGFTNTFTGFANYVFAFTGDPDYNRLLTEELTKMVTNSLATLVLSFVVAVLLNQNFKGRALVRAIFFLPVILSSGVLVGLETNNTLLSGMSAMIEETSPVDLTGALKDILVLTGLGTRAFEVVFDIINQVYNIVIASGIQIIVFLSGLQNIPRSLYEAADVEGCTAWESFWKITFPMISPLLLVNCIYTIIDFFMKSDNEVMERINDQMLEYYHFGISAAMSWIYFAVTIALIGVCSAIISKGVHHYE